MMPSAYVINSVINIIRYELAMAVFCTGPLIAGPLFPDPAYYYPAYFYYPAYYIVATGLTFPLACDVSLHHTDLGKPCAALV